MRPDKHVCQTPSGRLVASCWGVNFLKPDEERDTGSVSLIGLFTFFKPLLLNLTPEMSQYK